MTMPSAVTIVEVGPARRPAERGRGDPDRREARLHRPPRAPPACRDRGDVVRPSARRPAARGRGRSVPSIPRAGRPLPGPRPTLRGLERAIAAGADEIAVVIGATDEFNRANLHRTTRRGARRRRAVIAASRRPGRCASAATCRSPSAARTTGAVAPSTTATVAVRLLDLGCDDISLGDTIGAATPGRRQPRPRRRPARHRRRTHRPPRPRHAGPGARQRPRGAPAWRHDDRQLRGRPRRLPVRRPGGGRQPRDRGPRLPARRAGHRARREPRRRHGGLRVHRQPTSAIRCAARHGSRAAGP